MRDYFSYLYNLLLHLSNFQRLPILPLQVRMAKSVEIFKKTYIFSKAFS